MRRAIGYPLSAISFLLGGSLPGQTIPSLPDSSGWGVHVLALARAPDSSIWVGTYGQGIFVLRNGAWEHIRYSPDTAAHSISWDFVHAFAFGSRGEVWYGTVGNGWGVSTDGGKTWKNWELRQLGPEWQYVAPNGIVARGDTVYIATADGIKVTWDDGATWSVITDSAGATTARDAVLGRIQSQYVLAIAADSASDVWISTLKGLGHSPDGGRTWHEHFPPVPCAGEGCVNRARALLVDSQRHLWVGTERGVFRFGAEFGGWKRVDRDSTQCPVSATQGGGLPDCPSDWPAVHQLVAADSFIVTVGAGGVRDLQSGQATGTLDADPAERMVSSAVPLGVIHVSGASRAIEALLVGSPLGVRSQALGMAMYQDRFLAGAPRAVQPRDLRHTWFGRPIARTDQPYIDQTYRFGSTMGGNFQPHQGVEFNNSDGTPVHAIGDGVVVYSGPAEAGANTVAIRHDRRLKGKYVFSVYYHNTKLLVTVGQRVKAGDVIALVGNTGRATNDHLHLEVHVAPTTDSSKIVDPAVRYPPFNTNPELWIDPLPGTGVVAGQVWDAHGHPVPQARIYGLVKPEPQETPFSFIETYGPKNHSDPVYHEHFAIGDVPPGDYFLGVEIEGKKVYRRVQVAAGKLTWVEFRP